MEILRLKTFFIKFNLNHFTANHIISPNYNNYYLIVKDISLKITPPDRVSFQLSGMYTHHDAEGNMNRFRVPRAAFPSLSYQSLKSPPSCLQHVFEVISQALRFNRMCSQVFHKHLSNGLCKKYGIKMTQIKENQNQQMFSCLTGRLELKRMVTSNVDEDVIENVGAVYLLFWENKLAIKYEL